MTEDDSDFDDMESINAEKLNTCAPFPDECHDEIEGIEGFHRCFESRYSSCPVFYPGSLLDACKAAFNFKTVPERRPLLIYIHNDDSKFMSSNIFCKTIFCSEIVIDYLLGNYIVWPWDVTSDWNREKLIRIWREIFFEGIMKHLSIEEYPMLIGVTRWSANDSKWTSKSEYRFKVLLAGDTLLRTREKMVRQKVVNELRSFKEEHDRNEQCISFDFFARTKFSWEVVLEITKYLSLNDSITVFSKEILPIMSHYKTRVQISNPSFAFLRMILQNIKPEQIISLHLNSNLCCTHLELSELTNVISLTLFNVEDVEGINQYAKIFLKLSCLSLWYDMETSFSTLSEILRRLDPSIGRVEIHCPVVSCSMFSCQAAQYVLPNYNIRSLSLDLRYSPLSSRISCGGRDDCFLVAVLNFIKNIHNLRYIRLVISKHSVNEVVCEKEWNTLLVSQADQISGLAETTVQRTTHRLHEIVPDMIKSIVNAKPRRVDTHHHIVPDFYAKAVEETGGDPNGWSTPQWSIEQALEHMSTLDIDLAIVSVTAPGTTIYEDSKDKARALARQINEFSADLVKSNPKRFGFFASLPPLTDVEGTLSEIDYVHSTFKPDGYTLFTSYGHGQYLGHPSFKPIWTKLNELKAIVFIHPSTPPAAAVNQYLPVPMIDFPHETSRTAADLVVTGTRAAFPDVKMILSHAGGTLPFLAHRIAIVGNIPLLQCPRTQQQILADFRSFYYDTTLSSSTPQLKALLEFADPSKILFGSDLPYAPFSEILNVTKQLDSFFQENDSDQYGNLWQAINRENAQALFPDKIKD